MITLLKAIAKNNIRPVSKGLCLVLSIKFIIKILQEVVMTKCIIKTGH
jgi:hypothetical protein